MNSNPNNGNSRKTNRETCMKSAVIVFVLAAILGGRPVYGAAALDKLITQLKTGDAAARISASEALLKLGKKAEPAAGELVPFLKDEYFDVRTNVRRTFVAIGKPAVPHLRKALKHSHWHCRHNALIALERVGAGAELPADELRALLKDEVAEVRKFACAVVKTTDRPTKQLTSDLVALLDEPMVAGDAEDTLRHLFRKPSAAAREAAEPLQSMLAKAEGHRFLLLSALLNAAGIKAGFDRVLALYESDRAAKNEWFCKTIQDSNFPADEVVPVLCRELKAGVDGYEKWAVARLCLAAGKYGAEAAPAVPELARALKHKEECVRRYAAQALGNIGGPSKETLPGLREMAEKDPEARVRDWAAQAVKKIEAAK